MITKQISDLSQVLAAFQNRALKAIDLALAQSAEYKSINLQATLEAARLSLGYAVEAGQRLEALYRLNNELLK